jgi:small-conductance mechanosensitive channel/CRP-like cAMP-binding protein
MSLREWWLWATASPSRAALLLAAGMVALVVLRRVLHRSRIGHRLDAGLSFAIVGLIAQAVAIGAAAEDATAVVTYAHAIFIAAMALAVARIAVVLIVDIYLRERQHIGVSAIMRDVAALGSYFVIILVVLRATLDINLASLITTSAVLTAIIGLALQDALGSVISGLVLEAEEPFRSTDWVRVGDFEGQIVETGWRTTKIRTRNNELIVLPNTYLAREPLVNYVRPDPRHRDIFYIEAAYETPPNAVKTAILSVVQTDPSVLHTPAPEVFTTKYNASGIEYQVRYWLVDFAHLPEIRDRLMTSVWYALRRGGIRIPFPATDLFVHTARPVSPLEAGDVAAALSHVPLLAPLTPEELTLLASNVSRLPYARGEAIVREGEPGDSFYLIARGTGAASIGTGNGGARTLSRMNAGDCFGEMSLLTGEPRSATVVAESDVAVLEIERSDFELVLAANPALLEPISQIAARRQASDQESARNQPTLPLFAQDPAAQHLLQRIRTFFGL